MAEYGIVKILKSALTNLGLYLFDADNSHYVNIKAPNSITTNYSLIVPVSPPGSVTEMVTMSPSGQLATQAIPSAGTGTVTNFTATPTAIFDVATPTSTPALSLKTQNQNLFLAAPNGSSGTPAFRSLLYADIAAIVGTGANTLAAGNDSRFHTQNTDTGTTQTSFVLDSGGTPVRIKAAGSAIRFRNGADNADIDIIVNNITLTGTTNATVISTETLSVNDNIIVLNDNVTSGTPTEDGGIQVRRGASTAASINWDETGDFWEAGLVGSEKRLPRYEIASFTNANLTAGIYTFNHGLGNQYPAIFVVDNNNKKIGMIDDITYTDVNNAALDLTTFAGFSGTYRAVALG